MASPEPSRNTVDIPMTWQDREDFRDAVIRTFSTAAAAQHVLDPLGIPPERLPVWVSGTTPAEYWQYIFQLLDAGIVPAPYRRLLQSALNRYRSHRVFSALGETYLTPAAPPAETCHVIVRASTEDEREAATTTLTELGLEPRHVWTTEHAISFAVESVDVVLVRQALMQTNLGWTIVPPGQPDYVLRELFIQGPDGQRFRLTDAPAAQIVRNVASEVTMQYGDDVDVTRPTVTDVVSQSGERRRLNPDDTLHEVGLEDGDTLRVGFEGRAGAVHPQLRVEALRSAGRQLLDAAATRTDLTVHTTANESLPIEYDLEFHRPSFGPPGRDTGEPTLITRHVVRILLGPDFPEIPPTVFWLTPFFHPNVFPTYDTDETGQVPEARGLVCLGSYTDDWTPGCALGPLLELIIDIASYQNYDITEFSTRPGERRRGNFFDEDAAAWAATHGDLIVRRGGRPLTSWVPAPRQQPVVGMVERLDD